MVSSSNLLANTVAVLPSAGQHSVILPPLGQHNVVLQSAGQHSVVLPSVGQHSAVLPFAGQHGVVHSSADQHGAVHSSSHQQGAVHSYANQHSAVQSPAGQGYYNIRPYSVSPAHTGDDNQNAYREKSNFPANTPMMMILMMMVHTRTLNQRWSLTDISVTVNGARITVWKRLDHHGILSNSY